MICFLGCFNDERQSCDSHTAQFSLHFLTCRIIVYMYCVQYCTVLYSAVQYSWVTLHCTLSLHHHNNHH